MNSIRVRLLASLLAALVVAAAVFGLLTYNNVLHESEALFDYQLRQMALSLRDQGEVSASALADTDLDFVVQIWTADGRSVYASRTHAALPSRAVIGLATVAVDKVLWRTFSVASYGRVIQVAQPMQVRQRLAASTAWRSVWPMLLLAPLLGALMWWLVARELAPLLRLSREVRARDEASLSPLPREGLPDEVAPLVDSLNTLLQRLGGAFDAQRAFVADAAHELRSPLTALKLQVQLLQRAPAESDRQEALQSLSAGVERATRLVEQLLTLARQEPGATQAALQPVNLAEAVRHGLAGCASLASTRGSAVEFDADETLDTSRAEPAVAPAMVHGDAAALAVLARNLADNALRYSPPGSTVSVSVVAVSFSNTVLTVDDNGPGIPASERARAFDRFWRRDSTDPEQCGTGLGMAIVHRIAERHGASVSLDDSPSGGLRVTCAFPAS